MDHNPAAGIFVWDGTDCPEGEFRTTSIGEHLIVFFQPTDPEAKGFVQIHCGAEIQFAYTRNARRAAERAAVLIAQDYRLSDVLTRLILSVVHA
jgi:hypothetical protein